MRTNVFILLVAVFMISCASSTPVIDSPLPPAEEEALRCALFGTWQLKTIDGERVDVVDQRWVFRADGTGVYEQRPGTGMGAAAVTPGDKPFVWRLEGRNIFMDKAGGAGVMAVYRADAFNPKQMTWFNYRLSDNYGVQRTALSDEGCNEVAWYLPWR